MNKLDSKEIVKKAIDGLTYSKAYELYVSNRISMTYHRNENDEDEYDALITGKNSNKTYHVTAVIDVNGKVVKASCGCDYYETYIGYCKHILALLLKINSITNKKDGDILTPILSFYKQNVSLNIELTPIFYSHKYETGIEFKIGKNGKNYIVKSIPELFENIRDGRYFKYGKELEFLHSLSVFNKRSNTILDDISEYTSFYNPDPKGYFDGKRKCKIPKIIFKKILDMFIDEKVEFVFDDAHFDLTYTSESLELELIFENEKLSIKDRDKMKLFSIGHNFYVMRDEKLYCIDSSLNQTLIPLINTLYISPIEFNTKLYNEFFTYIYPKIKDDITIVNRNELEKNNNTTILQTKCYLDLEDGMLKLKYDFIYDGLEREKAIDEGIYINHAMEENFTEQLSYFNFGLTGNKNEYVIEDMDNAINFLFYNIEDLKAIAEVYISDKIKNLKPKKAAGNCISIKYSNNYLELIFDESITDIETLNKILKAMKVKKKYYLLKDGTVLNLADKYFQDLEETMETIGKNEISSGQTFIDFSKLLQLDDIIDNRDLPDEAIKFLNDLKNYDNINYPIDSKLSAILRDYQKTGVKWLINLAKYKMGGILADDMGLGKTLEIITLLKSCRSKYPSLIVCPASLTYNWYNEFKKWVPTMNIHLITGTATKREELIKEVADSEIIITSYDYLKRDIDIYKSMKFYFMIIDEAQYIKNHTTKNAETVKEINAISRFALTGTPIENSLADLWSIFDYCLPGYLKSHETFKEEFEYGIIKFQEEGTLERLNKQIAPFILRRTKDEVLKELPEKVEQVIYATMSEEQEKIYKATMLQAKEKIMSGTDEKQNRIFILSMLTRLRQIVCHPKLYLENYQYDSAKLDLTMNMVEDAINSNHKILIFSQFTSMIDILSKELDQYNIKHFILTGKTEPEKRYELVDQFNKNNEVKVFLISLKAGGTGLNLVGADMVIHYDPWWNMSAENQASDRVYRIGQKKNVHIIKVIAKNSIEEKILDLQLKKKELLDKVVSESGDILQSLSNDDLLSLFIDK